MYYKGDTHYFGNFLKELALQFHLLLVMCGKKHNLIAKGVIKSDKDDVKSLLAKDNVDTEALCKYVAQVVDYVTDGKLGQLEFSLNASKKPDVAAFDFTVTFLHLIPFILILRPLNRPTIRRDMSGTWVTLWF